MTVSNLLTREQCEAYLAALDRAWVAVPWYGQPQLVAVPFRWEAGGSTVRLPRCVVDHLPTQPFNAAVCADEGRWFFDLRGVHLKGTLTFERVDGQAGVYRFAEDRMRGWDYRLFAGAAVDLERDPPLTRARAHPGGIIRIATLSQGGRPHITPIWHRHAAAQYQIMTSGASIMVRNFRHHPRVTAVIVHPGGNGFYPCTYIQGTARFDPQGLGTLPAILGVQARYTVPRGALGNWWRYRGGLKHVSAYFKSRGEGGVVTITADATVQLASAEGVCGEWIAIEETDVETEAEATRR